MKIRNYLLLLALLPILGLSAQSLWIMPTSEFSKIKTETLNGSQICFSDNNITLMISTITSGTSLIDPKWDNTMAYLLIKNSIHLGNGNDFEALKNNPNTIYHNQGYVVLKMLPSEAIQFHRPAKSKFYALTPTPIEQIAITNRSFSYTVDTFPEIYDYVAEVDTTNIMNTIQHLQNYGTRKCFHANALLAQDWIKEKFDSLQLETELHDFPLWSMNPSDNVIATYTGLLTPDEYVMVGSHYDSEASGNNAPGADDNASGTAAVIEIARILSKYQFEKTIVFCTFSAEELGLIGSDAYVKRCKNEGKNIVGYVNLDMIGYQAPGAGFFTDIIYPASAAPLAEFYKGTTALYIEDFVTNNGFLSGGDSDHTSFNKYGYQGIFPFEDDHAYSPFIHTAADTIGSSVNSPALAVKFTQAALAAVACLAIPNQEVGIQENKLNHSVRILSNPVSENIRFSFKGKKASFSVFNGAGQISETGILPSDGVYSSKKLPKGLYILRVMNTQGASSHKVLVQ